MSDGEGRKGIKTGPGQYVAEAKQSKNNRLTSNANCSLGVDHSTPIWASGVPEFIPFRLVVVSSKQVKTPSTCAGNRQGLICMAGKGKR